MDQALLDAAAGELLGDLRSRLLGVLGERLIGLYLYGSLAAGDFDPGISDIDLLAATASDLDAREVDELRRMHRALADDRTEWADRVEVAYLSIAALRAFRHRRDPLAIISPGEPLHVTTAGSDWLMNWYLVREQSVTLFGPPAAALIDPISLAEFVAGVREHARAWTGWIDRYRDQKARAYAILTACRALHTVRTGIPASKRRAAAWVAAGLPEWSGLVESALRCRAAPRDAAGEPALSHAETVRFIRQTAQLMGAEDHDSES